MRGRHERCTYAVLHLAGYDFTIVDLEHTGISLETLQNHFRAARSRNIGALVRVPGNDKATILRIVECGAEGVMVPHISDADAARRAVAAARYAPEGSRGVYDGTPAADYAAHGFPSYKELAEHANREMVVAVMIEDVEGVDRVEEIVSVPGIDLVIAGPADLSFSMGLWGTVADSELGAAIERVRLAAESAGIRFAIPPDHGVYPVPGARQRAEWGMTFHFRGSDANALLDGLRNRLARMKAEG